VQSAKPLLLITGYNFVKQILGKKKVKLKKAVKEWP
jgi:hypothetical protein